MGISVLMALGQNYCSFTYAPNILHVYIFFLSLELPTKSLSESTVKINKTQESLIDLQVKKKILHTQS